MNEILNINCLEGIKTIADKSVSTVICDPPYFLGMTHNGQKGVFGDLNIAEPFFGAVFAEISRVLTDDGCVYWFCDWRSLAFFYPLMNKFLPVKNTIIWDKGSGAGNFYTFEHELVIFATKNSQFRCRGARNIIRDVPSFSSGAKKTNGNKMHPTQKPIELIAKLITDSTQIGDTVLDCFMGSGTTAVAAINSGRKYIGFEIDSEYHKIAIERTDAAWIANQIFNH